MLLGSLDVTMGSLFSGSADDCGSGSWGDSSSLVAVSVNEEPLLVNEEPLLVNEEPLLVNEELLEVKGLVEMEGEAE